VLAGTRQRLKYVHVDFNGWTKKVAEQVVSCLLDVPSISISFRSESARHLLPFTTKNLKIQTLSFYFSRYEPNSDDLNKINRLLTHSAQFLEQLTFECHRHLTTLDYVPIQLPILPRLRRLKLIHVPSSGFYSSQQQPSIMSSFRFVYPVTAIELPVLEEVDIEYTGACSGVDGGVFSIYESFPAKQCAGVIWFTGWEFTSLPFQGLSLS